MKKRAKAAYELHQVGQDIVPFSMKGISEWENVLNNFYEIAQSQ
jgi:hypothetical protein